MVTIIKKGTNKKEAIEQLDKVLQGKGVNTHKYCGVIHLKEDPRQIQKQMRDEWE